MTQIHRSELRNMHHFEINFLYTSRMLRVAPSDVTSVFTIRAGVQFVKFLVRYFYCNISVSNTVCHRQRSPKKCEIVLRPFSGSGGLVHVGFV